MVSISVDRNRISEHFKATVTVTSDTPFTAYEARGYYAGDIYGRGIGYCLLSDDLTVADGVVTLSSAVTTVTFDVEAKELGYADGDYRICVFVKTENGNWDDTCQLYTSAGEAVVDSEGRNVLAKRNGSGSDEAYASAYSGKAINDFITEVLG